MKIQGFSFSAIKAGVRYPDRLDLGLIYSANPCVAAGVFTTNQVKAAPVIIDVERLKGGRAQAILVNSGNANACTGDRGMETAKATSVLLSEKLCIADELVQLSSTGVIGETLDLLPFSEGMDSLVAGLSADNFALVSQAIMTTDTVQKVSEKTVVIDGREVTLLGMAKGAGMIMPNMATMLAFVMTDADITFTELQNILTKSTDKTFNRITVDGDTSTNDMVLLLANGAANNAVIDTHSTEMKEVFQQALDHVLKDLALQIVNDGEGATKTITISVCGAKVDEDAEKIARTVANSNLVKTAFFGEDANWGRIFAAMGRSGVTFIPEQVDISFGDVRIVKDGLAVGKEAEEAATLVLKEKNFSVNIDLKEGTGCDEIYTCDFSLDYVKINADYRS